MALLSSLSTDVVDTAGAVDNTLTIILAPDVLVDVFCFLELRDVVTCSQVSREFHKCSQTQVLWKNMACRRFGGGCCDRFLVESTVGFYNGDYHAMMADDNRLGALPTLRHVKPCNWRANNENRYYCCHIPCIKWDRHAKTVLVYFDVIGESDLRHPGTSSIQFHPYGLVNSANNSAAAANTTTNTTNEVVVGAPFAVAVATTTNTTNNTTALPIFAMPTVQLLRSRRLHTNRLEYYGGGGPHHHRRRQQRDGKINHPCTDCHMYQEHRESQQRRDRRHYQGYLTFPESIFDTNNTPGTFYFCYANQLLHHQYLLSDYEEVAILTMTATSETTTTRSASGLSLQHFGNCFTGHGPISYDPKDDDGDDDDDDDEGQIRWFHSQNPFEER